MNRFWIERAGVLGAAFVIDALLGDPRAPWHPIRLMGRLISFLEETLRRCFPSTERGELAASSVLALLCLIICSGLTAGLIFLAGRVSHPLSIAVQVFLCWLFLAARSLQKESMAVERCLEQGDLEAARQAVSMIVGRDTQRLDKEGIARAAVETVAENASDGVIAPLVFMAVGGAPLGALYKAVNTMDSMIGYKNDKYLYFGRAAARLDDIANFIPSRIAGILIIFASGILGVSDRHFRMDRAWTVFLRDRKKHASPNSAQTEAAAAGALGLRLAGDTWYFGILHHKPWIGDPDRAIEAEDISRANRLMYTAAFLCLILCMSLCLVVGLLTS